MPNQSERFINRLRKSISKQNNRLQQNAGPGTFNRGKLEAVWRRDSLQRILNGCEAQQLPGGRPGSGVIGAGTLAISRPTEEQCLGRLKRENLKRKR